VLLGYDHDEESRPVTENTEEIGKDGAEVFAACNACYGIYDESQENPEEARDDSEWASESLDRQAGGIGIWDIVAAIPGLVRTRRYSLVLT
jgi:hypothetical protein